MFVTPNMGLTAWDLNDDPYDHSQLAINFEDIDAHRHIPGEGQQIPTDGLQNSAVTSVKIAANNVIPTTHIPVDSIPESRMANNSVGADQIIDGSVGTAELADGAVTMAKLASGVRPFGEVIMWWRANVGVPLPTGWVPCDGRTWASTPNTWGLAVGNMPDLRAKFVKGAATTGTGSGATQPPDFGQTGGGNQHDLTHQHTVPTHSHTVNAHDHTCLPAGDHNHGFFNGTSYVQGNQRMTAVPLSSGWRQSFYIPELNRDGQFGDNVGANMQVTGSHAHVMGTTAPGTSASGGTTTGGLGLHDTEPAYVGLLFLMRVL